MIRNKELNLSFILSFIAAIFFHLVILFFIKKSPPRLFSNNFIPSQKLHQLKLENIKMIDPKDIPQFRRVGIHGGEKKDYIRPDIKEPPKPSMPKIPGLSLGKLAPLLPPPPRRSKENISNSGKASSIKENAIKSINLNSSDSNTGHFYFNPKKEKKIIPNSEQNNLKQEAYKNIPSDYANPVAQKMSNFEIRYERPEGVSEDELNSDEKAYYAFFKRSYANYLSKLYATYDKIKISRPGLERDFEDKHLLIGKIDYDEKGNIVTIKILKSSDSDNVHYFFEETLKELNLPNPPKSFIKTKKQFSTYYQIQIN